MHLVISEATSSLYTLWIVFVIEVSHTNEAMEKGSEVC
jgi:hypothetical protein